MENLMESGLFENVEFVEELKKSGMELLVNLLGILGEIKEDEEIPENVKIKYATKVSKSVIDALIIDDEKEEDTKAFVKHCLALTKILIRISEKEVDDLTDKVLGELEKIYF